jgi:hypothetical protein
MFACGLAASTSHALQYKRVSLGEPAIVILARGPIVPGDVARLGEFIDMLPKADRIEGFSLDSPGGDVTEAAKLAGLIRRFGISVLVDSGSECSSSCFLLFAAADHKFVTPDAVISVHSASQDGQETVGSMAFTTAMARTAADLGVPPAIVGKMVETPPQRVTWLTPADLASMGAHTIDPSHSSSSSGNAPAPESPPPPQDYGSTAPASAAPPDQPARSKAFEEGLADRQAWEDWFANLSGPFKDGAEYWSGQRSIPKPGSCYGPGGQNPGDWTMGCLAAKRLLVPSDVRRKLEPDYRAGWNSL